MRQLLFAAFGSMAALLGGCALIADYGFDSYKEGPEGAGAAGGGGAGGSTTTTTTTDMGGGGGSAGGSGGEGGDGGDGGAGGAAVEIASGSVKPTSIAVDGAYVYWTTSDMYMEPDGAVNRVDKDGLMEAELDSSVATASSVEVNSTTVFWFNAQNGVSAIFSAPKAGGSVTTVHSLSELAVDIAVNDQEIFWTASSSGIFSMGLDGTNPHVIIPGQSTAGEIIFDADGQKIYWVNKGVFSMNDGEVLKANRDGTQVELLASNQSFPLTLVVDSTRVYWATLAGGVFSVGKDGGAITTHVPQVANSLPASGVAVDSTHVYYTKGREVRRVPFGSMVSSLVYDGGTGVAPKDIKMDGPQIFFTTTSSFGGSVFKLFK